jgi:eukaryotic-like serine/threonine-protein kinase
MNEPNPVPVTRTELPTQASSGDLTDADQATGQRYGRFLVERKHAGGHGGGGIGVVYRAHDEELPRDVALKRIAENHANDENAQNQIRHEAKIIARLEHPGIVPIYGLVNDERNLPCYAMRYIEEGSLAEEITGFHPSEPRTSVSGDTQPLPDGRGPARADFTSLRFRVLLRRFISVCQTMEYAHDKDIIHGDLKPANILCGDYGETLVADWGLAIELQNGGACNPIGRWPGTDGYMAPEQAAGKWSEVGPRSDIYSLGATLYKMLTGKRPERKAPAGDIPRPCEVKSAVPKPLEAICLKAMAHQPGDRYSTATDLAADVENFLADEPVTAYAEPLMDRSWRWMRRHRALVTGMLSVAIPLLIVLAIVIDQDRHLRIEREIYRNLLEQGWPEFFISRVRHLLREQKLPDAVVSAKLMKGLAGHEPDQLYIAARAYALCAGAAKAPSPPTRGELADEAMALLKQAVAKGYEDIDHLKGDEDLKALRERDDYKKLLKDLEEKKP